LRLDVRWRPDPDEPTLGLGRIAWLGAEEMMPIKPAMRVVGGILRATEMVEWRKGKPKRVSTVGWSRFLAPDLWGVMMHSLHAIAAEARDRFKAIQWATDGGILPADRADELIRWLDDEWRLRATIRAIGSGTVWGLASWQVGDRHTVRVGQAGHPVHRIDRPPDRVAGLLAETRRSLVERTP